MFLAEDLSAKYNHNTAFVILENISKQNFITGDQPVINLDQNDKNIKTSNVSVYIIL